MSGTQDKALSTKAKHGAHLNNPDLPIPSVSHFAIVTCTDARLDAAKSAG